MNLLPPVSVDRARTWEFRLPLDRLTEPAQLWMVGATSEPDCQGGGS